MDEKKLEVMFKQLNMSAFKLSEDFATQSVKDELSKNNENFADLSNNFVKQKILLNNMHLKLKDMKAYYNKDENKNFSANLTTLIDKLSNDINPDNFGKDTNLPKVNKLMRSFQLINSQVKNLEKLKKDLTTTDEQGLQFPVATKLQTLKLQLESELKNKESLTEAKQEKLKSQIEQINKISNVVKKAVKQRDKELKSLTENPEQITQIAVQLATLQKIATPFRKQVMIQEQALNNLIPEINSTLDFADEDKKIKPLEDRPTYESKMDVHKVAEAVRKKTQDFVSQHQRTGYDPKKAKKAPQKYDQTHNIELLHVSKAYLKYYEALQNKSLKDQNEIKAWKDAQQKFMQRWHIEQNYYRAKPQEKNGAWIEASPGSPKTEAFNKVDFKKPQEFETNFKAAFGKRCKIQSFPSVEDGGPTRFFASAGALRNITTIENMARETVGLMLAATQPKEYIKISGDQQRLMEAMYREAESLKNAGLLNPNVEIRVEPPQLLEKWKNDESIQQQIQDRSNYLQEYVEQGTKNVEQELGVEDGAFQDNNAKAAINSAQAKVSYLRAQSELFVNKGDEPKAEENKTRKLK